MKYLLIGLFLMVQPLFAIEEYIGEKDALRIATWAGTGTLGSMTYYDDLTDEHIWRITLTVAKTLKGPEKKTIDFFFEQGLNASRDLQNMRVRCPSYPSIVDNSKVKIFLVARKIKGRDVYFLQNGQMIKNLKEF